MAIRFENVSYKDKLKNITCVFEDNKITSLIGASGSGKTLLSYLIAGLVLPTSGNVYIYGNIINSDTKDFKYIRKIIGYVFQNPEEQFFTNSVKEELEFSLKNYKYKLDKMERQVVNSLKMVGLDYLNRNPFSLSGGEKEKLAIAIALSLNPNILILDEPTIYLDDKSTEDLIDLLVKIKEKYNKTIIVISNDINFVNKISDNIIMLKKGSVGLNIKKEYLINNVDKIKKGGMEIPKILEFINSVEKSKKIKLSYTDNIDELVSEIKNNV